MLSSGTYAFPPLVSRRNTVSASARNKLAACCALARSTSGTGPAAANSWESTNRPALNRSSACVCSSKKRCFYRCHHVAPEQAYGLEIQAAMRCAIQPRPKADGGKKVRRAVEVQDVRSGDVVRDR